MKQRLFTGGGNTFLRENLTRRKFNDCFSRKCKIWQNHYLGTSAGSNIAGINMKLRTICQLYIHQF